MSDNSLSSIRVRVILRALEERAPFFTTELVEQCIPQVATSAEVDELVRLGYLERFGPKVVALTTQAHIFLRGID